VTPRHMTRAAQASALAACGQAFASDDCSYRPLMVRMCSLRMAAPLKSGRDWRPGRTGAAAAPDAAFSRPVWRETACMVPSMAGRAGVSSDTPVPEPGTPTPHGLPPLIGVGGGRFNACRYGAVHMADTLTAPASGRLTLRLPAQPLPRPAVPVAEYARAFALRIARQRAERNAARRAQRRAELRAKAAELVASDRLAVCGRA